MAGFHTKTFTAHDDYMTPKHAWEAINHLIPKKIIWEPFYGDGQSGKYLEELGHTVINEPRDFFTDPPKNWDIIVSNPPFSLAKDVMAKLLEYDKPFILLMPSAKINTSYIRDWNDKGLQIIIPRKRIQFIKLVNGIIPENYKSCCNFDCFYYCYGIGLPSDIIWLQ